MWNHFLHQLKDLLLRSVCPSLRENDYLRQDIIFLEKIKYRNIYFPLEHLRSIVIPNERLSWYPKISKQNYLSETLHKFIFVSFLFKFLISFLQIVIDIVVSTYRVIRSKWDFWNRIFWKFRFLISGHFKRRQKGGL